MNSLARSPRGQWPFFPPKWWSRIKIQTPWGPLTCQRPSSQGKLLPTPHLLAPQLRRRHGDGEARGARPALPSGSRGSPGGRRRSAEGREGRPREARLAARQPARTEKKAPPVRRCSRGGWVRSSPSRGQRLAARFPKNLQCYISNRNL